MWPGQTMGICRGVVDAVAILNLFLDTMFNVIPYAIEV